MKNIEKNIRNLLPDGIFLLELDLKEKSSFLRLVVDGVKHVSIQDTTVITKRVKNMEEINSLFLDGYRLEVTTPGIGKKLIHSFQYKKFLFKKLEITLNSNKGNSCLDAELIDVSDHGIKINENGNLLALKYDEIFSAKPKIKF
ncbi:MAG: hypothetical protein CMP35_03240 [Rickettsiales bacterium]|nr:hypothetical protein [Rickettsiales bacterium]|tara:strand:- start:242 stop:673 length:432 start_codon:yes stop_codon:yes gene_type:complete